MSRFYNLGLVVLQLVTTLGEVAALSKFQIFGNVHSTFPLIQERSTTLVVITNTINSKLFLWRISLLVVISSVRCAGPLLAAANI